MENNIKITYEKVLTIPNISINEDTNSNINCCIIDDDHYDLGCNGLKCDNCLCNINNFKAFSNSHNLQTL